MACIQVTIALWAGVLHKLDTLSVAASDNSQWTLGQMELEFARFLNAALLAGEGRDPDGLAELRRRFDIFYSRIQILASGRLYRPVAEDPEVRAPLARVQAFLAATLPLIEATDVALGADLGKIRASAVSLTPDIRTINVKSVGHFAASASAQRSEVSNLVTRAAAVTVLLIIALLGFSLVLVVLNRIAHRRAGERAVAEARLRTVVASALDAILVADASGRIIEYNPAAGRIFGWRPGADEDRLMDDILVPPPPPPDEDGGTADAPLPKGQRVQLQARRARGALFPAEVSLASVPGPEGGLRIAFLRDVSAQVANDQALREARDRALAGEKAKARFLAVMSHEMRTPLNGLLGSLELLEQDQLGPAQRHHLAVLRSSGELLLRHVNDVLDIARLDASAHSFSRDPFDPAAILMEVAESQRAVAAAGGNRIEIVLPPVPDRHDLYGDAQGLRRALLNLLGNAVKFTRNGRIALALAFGPETPDGLSVEFRVTDTGPGIAADDQARIFDEFVTLDASYGRAVEGTGLGLPIARRLVTAMGGEIGVESRPGEGSSFWFRLSLPVVRGAPARPVAPQTLTPKRSAARDVLMIEDNEVNRAILRAFLVRLGHAVDEARDGDEGVRLAALRRYDLILTDISMPRLSGVEATRMIRAGDGACRDAPIVAVTAHALPEEVASFYAAGMNGVLTKPIRLATLAEAIDTYCPPAGTADPDRAAPPGGRGSPPGGPGDGPQAHPAPSQPDSVPSGRG